MLKNRK